jgi:hypothetical protein
VLLRPENAPGGALRLVSGAGGWGGHGAYRVVQPAGRDRGWAAASPSTSGSMCTSTPRACCPPTTTRVGPVGDLSPDPFPQQIG